MKRKSVGNNLLSAQKAIINAVVLGSSKYIGQKISKEDADKEIRERLEEVRVRHGFSMLMNMIPFVLQKMKDHPKLPFTFTVSKNGRDVPVQVEGRIMYESLEDYYDSITEEKPKDPQPIPPEAKQTEDLPAI